MLQVRMLGPFEALADGRPVAVGGGRARSLLAILALSAGRAIAAEALVERCWGEDPPADPKASLHAAVRRLRVLLGGSMIRTTGHGYLLDVDPEQVDAVAFAGLLDPAGPDGRDRLDAALQLWRGEPFAGDFCDWLVQTERPRLIELWLCAVERRADLDVAAGRAPAVLAGLQELAARYPLRESLWVRLLNVMDAVGRSAEALEQYGVIRRRIGDELGVEPGAELRRVFERLLAGEPGEPAAETDRRVVPQQLPTDLPRFHGRSEVLIELDKIHSRSTTADAPTTVVVLHGQGGAGKTSLAVHWSHRLGEDFPDGRLFLDLHGYGPGAPVEPAVALENLLGGLGISADRIPSDVDGRSAMLRSTLAGRRVLMLLDNARNVGQVRPLLPGSGALVLITSRSRLRGLAARNGAETIAVEQLSLSESLELLQGRIPPQEGDSQLLTDLAQQCNRLPLALAIAAEQVLSHPERGLEQVVAELAELSGRLDALDSGDDPASDLRAAFSWSYRALDAPLARFFRLLGLIPMATFGTPAAAALTGSPVASARATLRRLADLHLVNEIAPDRFQLHDLLRAYAGERAAQDEEERACKDALRRLLDWYIQTTYLVMLRTGAASPLVQPDPAGPDTVPLDFADRDAARSWYDTERAALTTLVLTAAEQALHEQACRLGVLLWDDLYMRAAVEDMMLIGPRALSSARTAGLPTVEAVVANQLGIAHGMVGRMEEARRYFDEALVSFTRSGNARGIAHVHSNLGLMSGLLGQDEEELRQLNLSLAAGREDGSPSLISSCLNMLAMTHLTRGATDLALGEALEALELADEMDDRRVAQVEDTVGQIYLAQDDPDAAAEFFGRACGRNLRGDAPVQAVGCMTRHGDALRLAGRNAEARRVWEQALELAEQLAAGSPAKVQTGTNQMPTPEGLRAMLADLAAQ